jgi:protein transport protein SEC61 subunit gamma and related proteins
MAMQEPPEAASPRPRAEASGGIVDKAWDLQHRLEARFKTVGKGRYGRVLKMARKPDKEEFNQVAKVTAVGMLVVGGLGFLVYLIMGPLLHLGP